MNKGTKEGTAEEINLVKLLNNKKNSTKLWSVLGLNSNEHFAIHVTKHQFGKIQNKMIKPKADLYIASGSVTSRYLSEKEYCLTEKDVNKFKLSKIPKTGISVKRKDSKNYQILKTGPEAFKIVFGNYELGAGASLYCKREKELKKNNDLLVGWKTNQKNFTKFFENDFSNIETLFDKHVAGSEKIKIAKKIKEHSIHKIYDTIKDNKKIADYVFKGTSNFEEPYTAHWLYERGVFRVLEPYNFSVTTGSGRSRGDYTIVIKPK